MKNDIRIGIGLSIQGMSWCIVRPTDGFFEILTFEEHSMNEALLITTLAKYQGATIFSQAKYIKGIFQRYSGRFQYRFNMRSHIDDAGCAVAECINSGRLIVSDKDETLLKRVIARDWLEANENPNPTPAFHALKNGLGELLNELWGFQIEQQDEGS